MNALRPAPMALLAAIFLGTGVARAALDTTRTDTTSDGATVDGTLSADEYGLGNSFVYTGGGGGFGGTVGGAGAALYMESDASNIYFGFQVGNNLNDNVVIHLDTKSGGFTDSQMNDTADPGRNLLSNLTRDVDDVFPVGVLPDYGIVIGGFGIVSFELNAGNTPGHLSFLDYSGAFTGNGAGFREYALPRASIGSPSIVNFFVSYGSDTNFMSNESIPAEAFNGSGNPGFDNGGSALTHANYDQFVVSIPEVQAWALMCLVTGVWLVGCVVWRQSKRRATTA